jgi:phosphate transport system substrate-binding protein
VTQNLLNWKLDFGVDESPILEEDIIPIPILAGAIVLAVNLGPFSNPLVLSREIIVGIYNGSIEYWDNVLITTKNPNRTLPHFPITVIRYK